VKNSPLIILLGEPNSIFSEILFKTYKSNSIKKIKKPIVVIGSIKLLRSQMKLLKYFIEIKKIELSDVKNIKFNRKKIYIINVDYKFKKAFDKISDRSSSYINNCFDIALKLINNKFAKVLINGPISKTHFLKKKYFGITEYLSEKTKSKKKPTMLIYNPSFSVCPVTTHLPINQVSKALTKEKIINDVININKFYKLRLKKKSKFAVLGLNPHCESTQRVSEEKK
jgi:Pyridoxal phosphate biosynthesis protein